MSHYDHKKIEPKWQKFWEKKKLNEAKDFDEKPKFYGLIEFPYPSGEGLHVGHIRSNTAMDIICRKRRSEGYNVLYPIGWDAFGLPTENYAIKTGIHPEKVTKKNTDTFRKQLKAGGFSFDWSREINTTDPEYYKWTQWIFLKMFEKGLAYKDKININWCPKDKIGLANEEVVDGKCERCGTEVEKREKEQWMLAITKYADRLDKDLDDVNFLEKIKIQQRNWIGKSEGAIFAFAVISSESKVDSKIEVFTTRADTLFGVTYVVLAPENKLLQKLQNKIENWNEVSKYIEISKSKQETERLAEDKEKTGVELKGLKAINPANGEAVPIFVADYVLATYGTGAVMAVPAHDERDFVFAKKYNLPIKEVIKRPENYPRNKAYTGDGILINSGDFSWANGLLNSDASVEIVEEMEHRGLARKKITYKLRDWVFSRQRYWGEPIPMINCKKCGWVPVPEKDLPVELPKVKKYEPTDSGESPLASISKWVNVKCPKCGGEAHRETDTMPNWAGSSWYFLRYLDPKNNKTPVDPKILSYWSDPKLQVSSSKLQVGPVDWYNGGMEHTTLHLLYSRFWHKFLFDIGIVPTHEPYTKRTSHGMILAEGGVKMSKSKGNVINPDEIIKIYGADTLRIYEMFMGPFDQPVSWSTESIIGSRRFLEKVWKLADKVSKKDKMTELSPIIHRTIKKIGEDIETMRFNTAISQMMITVNELDKNPEVSKADFEVFLKILSPFAPHITEELWANLGNKNSIHLEKWPDFEESKTKKSSSKIVVQINGKVRASFETEGDWDEGLVKNKVMSLPEVKKWTEGKEIKKIIFVKGKLVNIVV